MHSGGLGLGIRVSGRLHSAKLTRNSAERSNEAYGLSQQIIWVGVTV